MIQIRRIGQHRIPQQRPKLCHPTLACRPSSAHMHQPAQQQQQNPRASHGVRSQR